MAGTDLALGVPGDSRADVPAPQHERDETLMMAVHEVGQVLAKLARAYGTLGDLGAIPGAAGLRAAANSTARLAAEMQAVADDIESRSPDRRQPERRAAAVDRGRA